MKQPRWWRGLFARVTLTYAIGSFLLSSAVAGLGYTIAANRLLDEAEDSARQQTGQNIQAVSQVLTQVSASEQTSTEKNQAFQSQLSELPSDNGRGWAVIPEDTGTVLSTRSDEDIPRELRSVVQNGTAAEQRIYRNNEPVHVVGIPLEKGEYYQFLSLGDLDDTLTSLRNFLTGIALASSLFGAVLGYYSARQALAPLSRVSEAAKSIAEGQFHTRLDMQVDPDLAALSRSFNNMVDALSTRIERDERFASDVSHELRSPLMTLTASVELLQRRKDSLPDIAQQAVTLLSDEISRFQGLVEDLLEISRLDAGAVQLQLSAFNLKEFLNAVIQRSVTPEIELSNSHSEEKLTITADKRRLAQVVKNLIDNGGKYGEGVTEISFKKIGKNVQIAVEDKGLGILPQNRQRVFERFGRISSDAGSRASGTGVGLGLALVAEHVKAHSGRVWVTDRIDGHSGARFVVELPIGEFLESDEEMAV